MDKILQEALFRQVEKETRRNFLKGSFMGLGGLALGSMLGCSSDSKTTQNIFDPQNPLAPKPPHFAPRAKSVIYLHMAGAPSQLELFDYKPELAKLDGQDCPSSFLEGKKFAFIRGVPKMLASQAIFKQYGQSGAFISNYLPHLSTIADDLSFILVYFSRKLRVIGTE